MRLSLQQQIVFFTLSSCSLFFVLVISILWSSQVVDVAYKRQNYANSVENHTNILKQYIVSRNIYANNYNIDNWLALDRKFDQLLRFAPSLTPKQQTIQNSIKSQKENVIRLYNIINENKLKHADDKIKKNLKIRLMTQLEAIRADSMQLASIVQKDIKNVIRKQVIFILSILTLVIFTLVYGSCRLIKIFRTSLKEVKVAFEQNHSGCFQQIKLSNQSDEFNNIASAFNKMITELSETTISLEGMKKIVKERTFVLEQQSNTDFLTKAANRRSLFERGNTEFSRVQRTKSQLTVILLDCDFFKNVNDQFGHLFGDQILINISKICTQEIRNIDLFARYGGEEFIIVLPDSDLKGAIETSKRIQRSLAKNCIAFEGKDVCVTVSIGICSVNDKHENFEQLIKDADIAMYKAKTNGRNRIETVGDNSSQ
jgi:diguanylate cyclase (GGDEF)-like protein